MILKYDWRDFDVWIASFLWGFAILSFAALFSSRLGIFNAWACLGLGGVAAVFGGVCFTSARQSDPSKRIGVLDILIVVLALVGGVFSGKYASNDMWGGRDPGIYMQITSNIARTASSAVTSDEQEAAFDEYADILADYPGYYDHRNAGHVGEKWQTLSQFNDLTPAIRAVPVQIFGIDGYGVAAGALGFALLLSVGALARQAGYPVAGIVAIVLLSLNASYIYASRGNMSETPTAFFIAGFFYALALWRNQNGSWLSAILLILYIGLTSFARIDGYFIWIAFAGYCVFITWSEPKLAPRLLSVFIGGALFSIFSFWDLQIWSGPYVYDLMHHWAGGLPLVLALSTAAGVLGLIVLVTGSFVFRTAPSTQKIFGQLINIGAFAAVGLALVVFAIKFAMGLVADPTEAISATYQERVWLFQDRNAVELSWYLTVPLILLFLGGSLSLLAKGRPDWLRAYVIFALFGFCVFVYRTQIAPDHPWASRRWMTYLTIPLVLVASIGMNLLWDRMKWIGLTISVLVAGYYSYSNFHLARQWYFFQDKEEYRAEFDLAYDAMVASGEKVFFVSPRQAASVLNYHYDIVALPLKSQRISGLTEIYKDRSFCTRSYTPWQGYSFYDQRGMTGSIVEKCSDVRVFVPSEDLDFQNTLYFLDFSNGMSPRSLTETGWYSRENWGVWSKANDGQLNIPLKDPEVQSAISGGEDLLFEIHIRGLLGGTMKENPFTVSVNGTQLHSGLLTSATARQMLNVNVPNDVISGQEYAHVEIAVEVPASPLELGLSSDKRVLGVGLEAMIIKKAE